MRSEFRVGDEAMAQIKKPRQWGLSGTSFSSHRIFEGGKSLCGGKLTASGVPPPEATVGFSIFKALRRDHQDF